MIISTKTGVEKNATEVFFLEYHFQLSEKRNYYVLMVSTQASVSNYAWHDIANDRWRLLWATVITHILMIA